VTSREHQLLHLATVAEPANDQLYIETCDLSSVTDIRRFASEWETRAAVRRGALGEEIGRQHLDTLLLLPTDRHEASEPLELLRALLPSLLKPTSVPGAPSQQVPTRVIGVLRSPFYAAADAAGFEARGTASWRDDAAISLQLASLLLEEHRRVGARSLPATGQVACYAVSPGLTRSSIVDLIRTSARDRATPLWALTWLATIALMPMIWAVGRSAGEAARAVERVVLTPLEGETSVKAGTLYRGTTDAG
jgi:hypothetical protein